MTTTKKPLTRWDASTYESNWYETICLLNERNFIINILKRINLPDDAAILEIGTGSGKWSAAFAIMGYKVTAVDNNLEILKQVKRNFPNIKIDLVEDELPDLKSVITKQKYEIVFNEGVIEHFLDKKERIRAIRAMGNCCINGGFVYFFVPFLSDQPDEHRYTSIKELHDEIVAAGLKSPHINIFKIEIVDHLTKQKRHRSNLQVVVKKEI